MKKSKIEINDMLDTLKRSIENGMCIIVNRPKNAEFMAKYHLFNDDIMDMLKTLSSVHFVDFDEDRDRKDEYLWIFTRKYWNIELYIKIKLDIENSIIISCHES